MPLPGTQVVGWCPAPDCGAAFPSWTTFVQHHVDQHLSKDQLAADICGQCLMWCRGWLPLHAASHNPSWSHCPRCSARFTTTAALREHWVAFHRQPAPPTLTPAPSPLTVSGLPAEQAVSAGLPQFPAAASSPRTVSGLIPPFPAAASSPRTVSGLPLPAAAAQAFSRLPPHPTSAASLQAGSGFPLFASAALADARLPPPAATPQAVSRLPPPGLATPISSGLPPPGLVAQAVSRLPPPGLSPQSVSGLPLSADTPPQAVSRLTLPAATPQASLGLPLSAGALQSVPGLPLRSSAAQAAGRQAVPELPSAAAQADPGLPLPAAPAQQATSGGPLRRCPHKGGCSRICSSWADCIQHMMEEHTARNVYRCKHCLRPVGAKGFAEHENGRHPWECSHCEARYRKPRKLEEHLQKYHGLPPTGL